MVIFEMLVARGARLNAKNHGGDTPLHLAAAHGHRDIVQKVSRFIYIHKHDTPVSYQIPY